MEEKKFYCFYKKIIELFKECFNGKHHVGIGFSNDDDLMIRIEHIKQNDHKKYEKIVVFYQKDKITLSLHDAYNQMVDNMFINVNDKNYYTLTNTMKTTMEELCHGDKIITNYIKKLIPYEKKYILKNYL